MGGQWNLITSAGTDATQSVFHLHVHLVPRRPNDGLKLPWSEKATNVHANTTAKSELAQSSSSELDDKIAQELLRYYGEPLILDAVRDISKLSIAWSDKRTLDIIGIDDPLRSDNGPEYMFYATRNGLRKQQRARLANNTKEQK
jgi:hypothetical protein